MIISQRYLTFYKGTKVPFIPPISINNKIISDFTKKAKLFNYFFTSQCTSIRNNSMLPSKKYFKTNTRLYQLQLNIKTEDIVKIIWNPNVNKAHDHDDIFITMLKICDSVLTEPLSITLKTVLEFFQIFGKCLILYHSVKRMINAFFNYCPVSRLPICGKRFERIIFNVFLLFEITYLLLNNLVLGLMIPVSISFYQLFTVFTQILIIFQQLK